MDCHTSWHLGIRDAIAAAHHILHLGIHASVAGLLGSFLLCRFRPSAILATPHAKLGVILAVLYLMVMIPVKADGGSGTEPLQSWWFEM